MAENETVDELNRKKRTVANRNMDTIVTTSENEKDIYSRKVFDFTEFVETSTDENAIKIRMLKKYGVSDDMIVSLYKDMFGTVVTQDVVMASLATIFRRLAIYISLQPNGVVIDLKTGEIDSEASFAQAIEYGIYSEDSVIQSTDVFIKEQIEKIKNYDSNFTEKKAEEFLYLINNFSYDYINKEETKKDINDFLEKDINEIGFSDALKKYIQQDREFIANSEYEKRLKLFEITKIELELEKAAGTPKYNVLMEKRKKFYEEHPEYVGNVPVRRKDGSIDLAEVEKYEKFKEAYQIQYVLSQIDEFKKVPNGDINNISEQSKRNIVMGIIAGLNYDKRDESEIKEIVRECSVILEKLCPGFDFSNKDSKEMKKKLADFVKKEMGFKEMLEELDFSVLTEFAFGQVEATIEDFIISDTEIYRNGINFDGVNISENIRYDSAMKNYFVGSKINFEEKDEEEYNMLYQEITVSSWLENKEDAIRLRYTALLDIREQYKKMPNNEYIAQKIKQIENDINKFKKEFGKIDIEPKEGEMTFNVYKHCFVDAGLMKYLTRDAMELQEGKSYESLDNEHKKGYIRNVLVALEHKDNPDFCITKMALRRLELMNSNGKQFIIFDKNGEYKINEELILQEYNRMSNHTYADFDELVKSAELRKNEYLLKKLDEYAHLRDKDFKKLDDKNDKTKSMEQIEEARYISNQKSIYEMVQEGKIKKDRDIIVNSPYETDMHLFEICKLQLRLKDPKNVENTQMYSIMLAKIKDFYKENPEYIGKEIPVLNADGTLNDQEIEKMNQYSEAYQRIVILKHLDMANGYGISKLSQSEKKDILLCTFAGLKYKNSSDDDIRELSEQSMNVIKQLYPQLNLKDEKALAKFFVEEMGFSGKIDSISLDELISINSLKLKEATESYIEKDSESYLDKDIDLSTLNFESSERKVYSSVMKNYFVGSRMKFTEKDEKQYNELYQRATVESWIEDKENAIKLRYAALLKIRDEYKNNPVGTYTEKKIVEIEKAINEFEDKYGKIDITEKKGEVPFGVHREDFINAGITKFLTRDASDWSDGVNYDELDDEHKKGYIRNILVVLEKKDNPSYLTKIALRRLELMNSDGKEFVVFNEKGEYKINKELILEEYKGMSDYSYASYNELAQSAKLRKNEYLLKKLEEYTQLDGKAFLRLDSKNEFHKSMEQIEKARYLSNQIRINEMIQGIDNDKIADDDLIDAINNGKLSEQSVNTTGIVNAMGNEEPRTVIQSNQYENNDSVGNERKPNIEIENIDVSATQNKKMKFIDRVKNAFKDIKDKFKKIIKGEDEEEIKQIGPAPANEDVNFAGMTTGNNSTGYDINKQYHIDHNFVNSEKNVAQGIQSGQETEVEGREN